MTIIEELPGHGPPVDSSRPPGPALVAAAADADPVTLLVLGWLAAHRPENTRTAYARDIGISPPRRPRRAPSWLTWCQDHGVHPVAGVTVLHVTRYARQLESAGLSPASAARPRPGAELAARNQTAARAGWPPPGSLPGAPAPGPPASATSFLRPGHIEQGPAGIALAVMLARVPGRWATGHSMTSTM